jgi:hypothetical protein
MAEPKLFDYNSSFSVLRTNPAITGNLKITVDSKGGVSFNSFSANTPLSSKKFKKFNITGKNPFNVDVYNFFEQGQTPIESIFQVAKKTNGETNTATKYSGQYDFFYGSGASLFIDPNYPESFSYLSPLWIKDELPDFFVIFKVPGPLSYSYTENVTSINSGIFYKVIADYDSSYIDPETNLPNYKIRYGKDPLGNDIFYYDGSIFQGNISYNSYDSILGSGKVVVFDELYNLSNVDNVENTFKSKILPNATSIKTFDLRENTTIGSYIRSIINNPNFSKSPIDINWSPNGYSYWNGVDIKNGVFGSKGEILYNYFRSSESDSLIDFENYITSGFSRNGIICPNLLNLEFLFDDDDSDLYTINRYFGMYVSRNDISSLRSNGKFFYEFKDLEGNDNLPKPSRDNLGYYYNTKNNLLSATSGIRFFYENSSGFSPGSNDVNISDEYKLFYLTDKNENFYSLKRSENYDPNDSSSPNFFGPYDYTTMSFGGTGSTGATSGSLSLHDTKIDLLDFTGVGRKIATIKGSKTEDPGRSYIDIEFLKAYDLPFTLTFKIFWPNGSQKEGSRKYDIVESKDLSSIFPWLEGAYYSSGDSYYFNALLGSVSDISGAFANVLDEMNPISWDTGSNEGYTIIRSKNTGVYGNSSLFVSVFDDYVNFKLSYKKEWNNTEAYSSGDVVLYLDRYYQANSPISSPPLGNFNSSPNNSSSWDPYYTFSSSGYLKIKGVDPSSSNQNFNFTGGTKTKNNRLVFSNEYSEQVRVGDFIKTLTGFNEIKEVTRYVESPEIDPNSKKVISFKDFLSKLVVEFEDDYARVDLGSDESFNTYSTPDLKVGVFTFFDTKEFDFDFFSSDYSYNPFPETYRYYQIQPGREGVIEDGIYYFVKQGQIIYNSVSYSSGDIFTGVSGASSYTETNPNPNFPVVVFPSQYSNVSYDGSTSYSNIGYEPNLDSFNGFLGIQKLNPGTPNSTDTKTQIFSFGKLDLEYDYLQENYNPRLSNFSRIVPFVNKWAYSSGTDGRGNAYRLNSTPAFSPTNFSPSVDRNRRDSKYLTHEWFLLESIPYKFPIEYMGDQNSYLPEKIDLNKCKNADPNSVDSLYLPSYFTVDPSDYPIDFRDLKNYTKELFTPLVYNPANQYYETVFRGVKITIKKRSDISGNDPEDTNRYVPAYKGFEDYRFSAILRAIPEDSSIIQPPIKYEIIENSTQKFILFICDVVIKDQKSLPIGYTGGTGSTPGLDYTLLYTLSDKEKLTFPLTIGEGFNSIDDIKLSVALDLSLSSGSSVNTVDPTGFIYSVPNPDYNTDLREEITRVFSRNTSGATSGPSPTGPLSFYAPSISTGLNYPWPVGVNSDSIEFGRVTTTPNYTFNIPYSFLSPATVPVGPSSIYKNQPVFQVEGGNNYYDGIMNRLSVGYIFEELQKKSQYIKYKTYSWDPLTSSTVETTDSFEIIFQRPDLVLKPEGSFPVAIYDGPKTLGSNQPTGYIFDSDDNPNLASSLTRHSGKYDPIFRKIIHFDRDKNDTITGDTSIDLSFRNCNFSPSKYYFGISRNLCFTKVDLGSNILSNSSSLPQGSVYPLVGQTPISIKDFNVFSSSWDPGYYERFTLPETSIKVAGTRSMEEYKTFMGSKIMKTPFELYVNNYTVLQISKNSGDNSVNSINQKISSYIKEIQEINKNNSGTGIGIGGTYLSGIDLSSLNQDLFPGVEVFYQYFPDSSRVFGIMRLDRILRRYLLNSGIKNVFLDNIISEFGVGDPNSINDDINTYIDLNISPAYEGGNFNLYVKKVAAKTISTENLVVGDISSYNRATSGYSINNNYTLTKINNLVYNFTFDMERNFNYSLSFSIPIIKI